MGLDMGVSKNRGIPKWMVKNNGKHLLKRHDLGGKVPPIFGPTSIFVCWRNVGWLAVAQVWAKADAKLHHGPFHVGGFPKKFNLEVPGRAVLKTCGKIGGPKYETTVTNHW